MISYYKLKNYLVTLVLIQGYPHPLKDVQHPISICSRGVHRLPRGMYGCSDIM